ncbi:MAG: class I SAM-dependent methyltransferase [Pseudomonadota bacterium]
MSQKTMNPCPLSGRTDLEMVFELKNVPVICNQLWSTAEAAKGAPMCDVDLAMCPESGLISNVSFEEDKIAYAPGYENALHFSPRFQSFAEELVAGLVERHDLKGKDVVEIGCGDGHILSLMMKHGARSATGFDPSMAGKTSEYMATPGVEILPEYFRSDQLDRPFDIVLCRHVLEHLPAPMMVMSEIRKAIGDREVPIYFETPNAEWMLGAFSMWDVIYEHVTYWSAPAYETLFRRAGFKPASITTGYGDQFMMVEGAPREPAPTFLPSEEERARVRALAQAFGDKCSAELNAWRKRLAALANEGGSAVVWGAGSKGITFSNAVSTDAQAGATIRALVDVNARKHGMYAPGVGVPVIGPDALRDVAPSLVLVSNEIYLDEIEAMIGELGLTPEFAVIAG